MSNQKHKIEGIPSLLYWKIAQAGYLGYFLKMRTNENRTTEIRRSQGPGVVQQTIYLLSDLSSQRHVSLSTLKGEAK